MSQLLLSVINVVVGLGFVLFSPDLLETRIYYAVFVGHLTSTIYLVWRFFVNKSDLGQIKSDQKVECKTTETVILKDW